MVGFSKKLLIISGFIFLLNYVFFNYTILLIIPLIKTFFLLSYVYSWGYVVLKKFFNEKFSLLESLGVGLIVNFFVFYVISFLKLLSYKFLIVKILFLPLIIVFLLYRKEFFKDLKESVRMDFSEDKTSLVLYFVFFSILFIFASLPPTFYDTLVYHLGIPNLYLRNGGFIKTINFLYANTSVYYEISLIPAVFLGEITPRLFHLILCFVFVVDFTDYMSEKFEIKNKYLLFLALISIPVTFFLITTVKNDIITAMFLYLGIKSFFKEKYIISGIFFGFSIGVKYFSIIGVFYFIFSYFVFELLKKKRIGVRKYVLVGFMILIVLFPLFVKNYVFTGNPVFPFFYKLFKTQGIDSSRYAIMKRDIGRIVRNFYSFFTFPYYSSFYTLGSGGKIGPLFIIFLPFLAFFKFKKPELLLFSLLSIFTGIFFTGSIRFLYFALIFLIPYIIIAFENFNNSFLFLILFLSVGLNLINSIVLLDRYYNPTLLYTRKVSIYDYKVKFIPYYKAYSLINKFTRDNSKVLIVGEARGFYMKKPYMISTALDYSCIKYYLGKSKNGDQFFKILSKDGYSFLIVSIPELLRLGKKYKILEVDEIKKLFNFLRYRRPVFTVNETLIYSVKYNPKITPSENHKKILSNERIKN